MSSLLVFLVALTAQAQALHFDVVSIHENTKGGDSDMPLRNGFLHAQNMLLKSLITSAYGVNETTVLTREQRRAKGR